MSEIWLSFIMLFDSYSNVYQRWNECWQIMIVIRRESEWLKEVITTEEGKERLREHNKYGWSFVDYLEERQNTLYGIVLLINTKQYQKNTRVDIKEIIRRYQNMVCSTQNIGN